jgi:ABC-type glycerol-3-phosphate transport system substrate-binding protein
MNVCKTVQQKTGVKYGYGLYSGAPQGRLINIYQTGGSVVNTATKKSTINSPKSVQALGTLKAMYDAKLISPDTWTTTFDPAKEFVAGNLAMSTPRT